MKPPPLNDPGSQPLLSDCPKCGKAVRLVERSSMSGDDMQTYRCEDCQGEHIMNFGTALWKILSDARKGEE